MNPSQKAPVIDFSSSESEPDEVWDVVPVSRKHRKHVGSHTVFCADAQPRSQSPHDISVHVSSVHVRVNAAVSSLTTVLEREGFWTRYDARFMGVDTILAYGIGSVENSMFSLFQFAFLLVLKGRIESHAVCKFFEPVMTEVDRQVIESYGVSAARKDSDRSHAESDGRVLFYMPHCDRTLYEWVLANKVGGDNSVFISNLFSFYTLQFPTWEKLMPLFTEDPMLLFKKDSDRYGVVAARPFTARVASKSDEVPFQAFNDLAFLEVIQSKFAAVSQIIEDDSQWCTEI